MLYVTLKAIAPETSVCCEWAELFWDHSLTKSKGTNAKFGRNYLASVQSNCSAGITLASVTGTI